MGQIMEPLASHVKPPPPAHGNVPAYGTDGHTICGMGGLDRRLEPLMDELRDLLHEKRLSQAQAEKAAGLPRKYLSRLMNGHVDMKLVHLYDVLDALGVDPLDFFGRFSGFAPPGPLAELRRRLEMVEEKVSHEEREPRQTRVGGLGR